MACVPPGTYAIIVLADDLSAVCGDKYVLSLDCAPCVLPRGACCVPDGTCISDLTEDQCEALDGTWQDEGSGCDPNPCPQPPANDNCDTAEVITAPFSASVDNSLATTGSPAGSCNAPGSR